MEEARLQTLLVEAMVENGLVPQERLLRAMVRHAELIMQWDPIHNLTAIRNPREMVYQHYMDCLLGLWPIKPPEEAVDVGSGAGLPGLIAALLWPDTQVVLVESKRKKSSFLEMAVRELGLSNVSILCKRAEDVRPYPFVMSRAAFSVEGGSFQVLLNMVQPKGTLIVFAGSHQALEKVRNACLKGGFLEMDAWNYTCDGASKWVYMGKRACFT